VPWLSQQDEATTVWQASRNSLARCNVDLSACRSPASISTVVLGQFAPLLGKGLVGILGEDRRLHVLESELDVATLERIVSRVAPNVVIIGEPKDFSLLVRLRAAQPRTGILVLAHDPTPAFGTRVLAAGATCIATSTTANEILEAVQVVAQGRRMFAPVAGVWIERRYPIDASPLTSRETEVLEGLSRNESNSEIAIALGVGIETVRTHVSSVLRKLHVRSRQELVGVPTKSEEGAT
jgi:DNA-binding NarL/FixJ family response regulator